MQPWVFTYSCTSFKCASHENESSGSGATEPDKSPSAKKKKREDGGISWTAQGLRKNVHPYPHLEVEAAEKKLVEEMNASYDLCTDEVWKDISRWFKGPYRAQRKIAFWSIFSRTYIDIKARVRFRLPSVLQKRVLIHKSFDFEVPSFCAIFKLFPVDFEKFVLKG